MDVKKYSIVAVLVLVVIVFAVKTGGSRDVTGIDVDFGFTADLISSEYSIVNGGSKQYEDPEERFSFKYPKAFTVGVFGDSEIGETVLLQKTGEKAGFQIFVTLFDEPGRVLTADRIQSEIPGINMIDPRPVDFDGDVVGISFISEGETFGRSREIWIAKSGFLYQMSTYEHEQSLLAEVMSSWSFR